MQPMSSSESFISRLIERVRSGFVVPENPFTWLKRFAWDLQIPGSARAFDTDFYAMVYLMFHADEKLGHDESSNLRNMIRTFSRAGSRSDELAIMEAMRRARSSGRSFRSYARSYRARVRGNSAALQLALEFLVIAAGSDGSVDARESALLQEACEELGISNSTLISLLRRLEVHFGNESRNGESTESEDPWRKMYSEGLHREKKEQEHALAWAYRELECRPGTDFDEVKKSYRALVMRFHPDRLSASNMPKELIEHGKARFLKIQHAFETLEASQ